MKTLMIERCIDAMIPTISQRPQCWYDLIAELIADGFIHNHVTAEWKHSCGLRGLIAWRGDKAWLRYPYPEPRLQGGEYQTLRVKYRQPPLPQVPLTLPERLAGYCGKLYERTWPSVEEQEEHWLEKANLELAGDKDPPFPHYDPAL